MGEETSTGFGVARALTFGERSVGLTFNPGGNPKVDEVKKLYANIIDLLNDLPHGNDEQTDDMIKHAILEAQGAQMWAVKVITWK